MSLTAADLQELDKRLVGSVGLEELVLRRHQQQWLIGGATRKAHRVPQLQRLCPVGGAVHPQLPKLLAGRLGRQQGVILQGWLDVCRAFDSS